MTLNDLNQHLDSGINLRLGTRAVGAGVMALSLMGLSPFAHAENAGTAALNITPSARAFALGGTNAVSSLGAEAIGANPANLGLLRQRYQVFSFYGTLMDGTQYGHLALALAPGRRFTGLGLAVTRLQSGGYEGADTLGNKTNKDFGYSDSVLTLGSAVALGGGFRFGAAGKVIQAKLASYTSNTALAGDAGFAYSRGPVDVAVGVNNLGTGMTFIQETDPLPARASLGVGASLGSVRWTLQADRFLKEKKTTVGSGLEYAAGPLALRAGFLARDQRENLALKDQKGGALMGGLLGGLGLRIGAAQIDYAIGQQAADYSATQRVAVSFQWGGDAPRNAKIVKKTAKRMPAGKKTWVRGTWRN
jgi:hypothetical protein